MSTFDIQLDAPGLLRAESLNITLVFNRTGPTTGRISWNIPTPAAGCGAATQAYCGMLLSIDNTPITSSKFPVAGTVYTSDPTVDQNLFVGDKLGTSLIVGAFYNDITTTFVDVTGLTPNTPYYVSGFPMDCQYRYFNEGVHAYSLDYTNKGKDGIQGYQQIILNRGNGVLPSDYTGLQPTIDYNFDIQIGVLPAPTVPYSQYACTPKPDVYNITINGTNGDTYTKLVQDINKQLALIDNPYQSNVAPNTGTLYWDITTQHLYTWDGSTNVITPVVIQTTSPSNVVIGSYWYNGTQLQIRDVSSWVNKPFTTSAYPPSNPTADTSYWFNSTQGFVWNGSSWCTIPTIIQTTDPTLPVVITPGTYWYEPISSSLYDWDNNMGMWTTTFAISSPTDPNTLPTNSYWFNTSNNLLYTKDLPGIGWNQVFNAVISNIAPTAPIDNTIWYSLMLGTLQIWQSSTSSWIVTTVINYSVDPTNRESCDLWWNTTTNIISSWDVVHSLWKPVVNFLVQTNDPTITPTIAYNTMWYNPITGISKVWFTNCFVDVNVIYDTADPIQVVNGSTWLNTSTNLWYTYNTGSWNQILPILLETDPYTIPNGTLWYNPSISSLQSWNGLNWINITFNTTSPAPHKDTYWFNTTTNQLLVWNGFVWVKADARAFVELDCNGNLLFSDASYGSLSCITIKDNTLFQQLSVPFSYGTSKVGMDEISNKPSWDEIGIGSDGSADQRLLLANQIKYDLGYPVVDVELTKEQLDYAITKTLSELRSKSGLGYKNGYFFLYTEPGHTKYLIANKTSGTNKVVDILSIQRVNSMANGGHDSGIYGQIFANFLYNAGNFDMLSYHLMTEYKKTYEMIFAQRIQWNWSEQTRELTLFQNIPYNMLLAIECTYERTEQDIMTDRLCNPWVRRYASAQARLMLAEIRGKFSTLPGAGGGITLNANDLRMAAEKEIENCLAEIDNFLVDNPAEWGMSSSMLFG